jgi:hypothetical protein
LATWRENISRDSAGISGTRAFFKRESNSALFMSNSFQQAFQFLAGGKHAPRNRGFGATQSFRGVRMGLIFVNGQDNGGALFGGQAVERELHLARKFIGKTGVTFGKVIRRSLRMNVVPATFPATPIHAQINGDFTKPGGKLGAAIKGGQLPVGAQKSILRQFFGIVERAGHAKCDRPDHFLILIYQHGVGFRVAGKASFNQLGFFVRPGHVRHFNKSDDWRKGIL